MPRILRTRVSRLDYDEIWNYIALRDIDAADRLIDHFDAALNVLASSPEAGRRVQEFAPHLRSFPVSNYLIFYRPIDDGIQLIRVVHGARDITPEYFLEK